MSIGSGVQDMIGGFFDMLGAGLQAGAQAKAWAFNDTELARARDSESLAAVDALMQGAQQGGFARMAASAAAAKEQVAYAAAGIDPSIGTAARVQSSAVQQGELGALIEENNARRAAMGHKLTSSRYQRQRELERLNAESAMTASTLAIAGGAARYLNGAASVVMGAAGM